MSNYFNYIEDKELLSDSLIAGANKISAYGSPYDLEVEIKPKQVVSSDYFEFDAENVWNEGQTTFDTVKNYVINDMQSSDFDNYIKHLAEIFLNTATGYLLEGGIPMNEIAMFERDFEEYWSDCVYIDKGDIVEEILKTIDKHLYQFKTSDNVSIVKSLSDKISYSQLCEATNIIMAEDFEDVARKKISKFTDEYDFDSNHIYQFSDLVSLYSEFVEPCRYVSETKIVVLGV